MKNINSVIFLSVVIFLSSVAVFAQETQTVVIDEVVAQVNDSVITLSQIKREENNAISSLIQEGKTKEEAQKLISEKKGELIANLINEQLLMQKGKEYSAESDVEARVNQQFLGKMKELKLNALEELYEAMRKGGVEPEEIRTFYRGQILRDMVFEREVDGKIFWGLSSKELKDYFEKNKSKFTKPETYSISEIFLGFAGRELPEVRQKAKDIVAQLKGGADFEKIVTDNSDNQEKATSKGKLGTFTIDQLKQIGEEFVKALEPVKNGGYSNPVEVVEGIHIFRVDDHQKASSDSFFDEKAVRQAIAVERIPEGRKKFMTELRQDAYIKINDTYRPIVSPVLYADDRKTEKAEK
ncbi:MAG: peptidylprolyl isomerase [Pyrinomonadaceae bacterium]